MKSKSCILPFFLTFLGILPMGCGRAPAEREVTINGDETLLVRHSWQCVNDELWKSELWVNATLIDIRDPIEVFIRLTRHRLILGERPQSKVALRWVDRATSKVVLEASGLPSFVECSKMKKGREVNFQDTNKEWGKILAFPPKEPCWQTLLGDPFNTDGRHQGTNQFKYGEYALFVDLTLEDGSSFIFEPVHISVKPRR